MHSKRIAFGLLTALLLSGCVTSDTSEDYGTERLAPCSAEGSVFADLPFENWPQRFHSTVSDVVEAHLSNIGPLQCTAESYEALTEPTEALVSLAQDLPPWKEAEQLEHLSETDLGAVLLEFTRVYECSLLEHRMFLPILVPSGSLGFDTYRRTMKERENTMKNELATARPAVSRLLTLIGGMGRLRPLRVEVECLSRTSLDIRNAFGLIAETSSCLPRITDARTSLRTPVMP